MGDAYINFVRNLEWKSAFGSSCMLEYYFKMRLRKNMGGGNELDSFGSAYGPGAGIA
jgi:hypothetical protein